MKAWFEERPLAAALIIWVADIVFVLADAADSIILLIYGIYLLRPSVRAQMEADPRTNRQRGWPRRACLLSKGATRAHDER